MISKKIIGISLSVIFISNISCPLVYAETIRPDKVKISIPTNMPSFNQSLSKTYQNALDTLKQEGFEVNNIPKENSVINPMEDLFSQKFPNNKTLTIEDVQNKFKEVDNGFSNKYENSKPENLPSKEATLIWDKNKILNSATKPKGFEEAIKETQGLLKGEISESFKNEVNNKVSSIIEKTKSSVNDKPTKPTAPSVSTPNTPKTPTAPSTSTPNRPKGENPPMPELVIPKQEEIKLPI